MLVLVAASPVILFLVSLESLAGSSLSTKLLITSLSTSVIPLCGYAILKFISVVSASYLKALRSERAVLHEP